jgi:hypothetical protein
MLRDIVRHKLSFRLVSPVASQELRFRDKTVEVSFAVGERGFQMSFKNLSAYDIKILWDRAQYTDVNKQTQRVMHPGVRFQDRNNPIPDQIVLSRSEVQQEVIPIGKVLFSQQKKAYEVQPLFSAESDAQGGLKGKAVILFLPVEINRQIILYNFKFEITNDEKELIKG